MHCYFKQFKFLTHLLQIFKIYKTINDKNLTVLNDCCNFICPILNCLFDPWNLCVADMYFTICLRSSLFVSILSLFVLWYWRWLFASLIHLVKSSPSLSLIFNSFLTFYLETPDWEKPATTLTSHPGLTVFSDCFVHFMILTQAKNRMFNSTIK